MLSVGEVFIIPRGSNSKRREALIVGRSKERRDRYATIRESQELVEIISYDLQAK